MELIIQDSVFQNLDAAISFNVRTGFSANIHTTLHFNDTIRNLQSGTIPCGIWYSKFSDCSYLINSWSRTQPNMDYLNKPEELGHHVVRYQTAISTLPESLRGWVLSFSKISCVIVKVLHGTLGRSSVKKTTWNFLLFSLNYKYLIMYSHNAKISDFDFKSKS